MAVHALIPDDEDHQYSNTDLTICENFSPEDERLTTLMPVGEEAYTVVFAADERFVLVSYEYFCVTMWDRETGRPVRKFAEPSIDAVHVAVYGDLVVTTHMEGPCARIFDARTGDVVRFF